MRERNYYKIVGVLFTVMCFGLVAMIFNLGKFDHDVNIFDDRVSVGIDSVYYEDIDSIELLDEIEIGSRIKGTRTNSYLRGTFNLNDGIDGKVYVHKDVSPYIRITSDEEVLVFNLEDRKDAISVYESILEKANI